MISPIATINAHIARSRELAEKATEGPWEVGVQRRDWEPQYPAGCVKIVRAHLTGITCDTADFIAASRTLLPQYVEALSVAVGALTRIKNGGVVIEKSHGSLASNTLSKIAAILSPP